MRSTNDELPDVRFTGNRFGENISYDTLVFEHER